MHERQVIGRPLGGFTLVELLVVLAIMSVLIALLLPAIARTRESVYHVHCQSNLRQVFLAFNAYAYENGDYVPAPLRTDFTFNWHSNLGAGGYLGGYEAHDGNPKWSWAILKCASEKAIPGSDSLSRGYYYWSRARSSYQMHKDYSRIGHSTGWGWWREKWSLGPTAAEAKNRSLSDLAFVVDRNSRSEANYTSGHDSPGGWNTLVGAPSTYRGANYAFRHVYGNDLDDEIGGTANALFLDGHVEGRQHATITGKPLWTQLYTEPPTSRAPGSP